MTVVKGTRILVGAVQMLLHTGTSMGLSREALLAEAGIDEQELADRDEYLPFGKQSALGRAIARQRPGVHIGLATLRTVTPAHLGVLGYAIRNTSSLEQALIAFIRFQRLFTDGVRWTLERADTVTIRLDADPAFEELGYPLEGVVGLWLRLGRQLTGTQLSPISVRFRHAPLGDPAELDRFFATRVQFRAADNALELDASALELPLIVGQASLQPSLRQFLEARLTEIEGHRSFTARLRGLMYEQIPRGVTSKHELAGLLAVSPRTLNRRLKQEQTTFRAVLDEVRRELALAWLSDPTHAVYEVSFLLGYSEPSTFHRCFRRWTGQTPSAWRNSTEDST